MGAWLLIVLGILCNLAGMAQGFVVKTNKISFDFTKPLPPTTIPTIKWNSPSAESTLSREKVILIDVQITSDVPFQFIHFISTQRGKHKVDTIALHGNRVSATINQMLSLYNGENIFEIRAKNENGGAASDSRTILVGDEAITQAVDINRKDYALIFATDKYNDWTDLKNPIYDARTIESELHGKFGFETKFVPNGTYQKVMETLGDYNVKKFNPQDQLFIFFTGHGFFDETVGEGYVIASNTLKNDKSRTTAIPHTIIRQRIENIKCNHIFLVMDVCFGGTFDPVPTRSKSDALHIYDTLHTYKDVSESEFLVRKLTKRTRKFLTSGSKEYVSDGQVGMHSPFAAKFLQALRETSQKEKRFLSLTDLGTYLLLLPTEVIFGSFGTDQPGSDFVFIRK